MTEDQVLEMLQEMVKDIAHRYKQTTGRTLDLVARETLLEAIEAIVPTDCLLED